MSVVTDSLSSWPLKESEMIGSFEAGYGGSHYEYSDYGVDRRDHYVGHSRCHPGGILPHLKQS